MATAATQAATRASAGPPSACALCRPRRRRSSDQRLALRLRASPNSVLGSRQISSDPMKSRLIFSLLLISVTVASAGFRAGAGQGQRRSKAAAAAGQSQRSQDRRQGLFGRKMPPAAMPTRVIGFYAKGCIAGAEALPINGDTWQVMRLSRNRNWAIRYGRAARSDCRPGAQGCRLARHTGRRHVAAARRPDDHRARQPSGRARCRRLADADAEPSLSREEREEMSAVMMVRPTGSTSIRKSGRRAISPSSATPRPNRGSNASSSTRRSRRRCAARPRAIAAGFPRCGRL